MNQPRLEIDDLAVVIRESMTAQQNEHAGRPVAQKVSPENGPPKLRLQPDFEPHSDHRYHINDLLRYHDRVFVQAAYRAVLKRSPDETEMLRDLTSLRSGNFNKIDLLAGLRLSPEGRAKKVQLDGLLVPMLIRRLGQIPLFGYLIRLAIALVRLPNLVRDQREFGSYLLSQHEHIAEFINAHADRLHTLSNQQQEFENVAATSRAEATQQLAALRFRLGDLTGPDLDHLYVALEDRFRGPREEIKERFREYLRYVTESTAVIDLGCGRGEWLELLTENGIQARGVDSNGLQVAQCRARGLDVTEQDLFVYLKNLPYNSADVITGFHIIEHLSLNGLVMLLNEVLHALRPGGIAIFETPNPENIVVSSQYFYLDPTHRHPLPPQLMEFLFSNRGFENVELLMLNAWENGRVADDSELAKRVNAYFYGPMDYAIVGRKAGS